MADPKGTYFGAGERGLATVLPSSPNFAGLAQMAQNANLRRQRLGVDFAEKRNKERQSAIESVSSMLQKGHTTGLIFQNELNRKVSEGIAKLSELAASDAKTEEIRAFGASLGQDLVTYAKSGQQVTALVDEMRKWNQVNGKMIDEGGLMKDVSERIIGPDNKIRNPSDITPDELAVENIVFGDKDGAGAKYLVKGKVISNLMKSPELKAAVVEHRDFEMASELPPGKTGTIETINKTKLSPIATVNQITGEVEIMDAERLVKSPIWQVLLNDRAFMTLVENEVSKAYAPKDSPSGVFIKGVMGGAQEVFLPKKENASPEELEEMRGKAAVALLRGTQFAGAEVLDERRLKMQNKFQARASGGATASDKKKVAREAGYNRFQNDVTSGVPSRMNEAASWLGKRLGISDESRSAFTDALGLPGEYQFIELTTTEPESGSFAQKMLGQLRGKLAESTGGLVAGDAVPKKNIIYAKFKKGTSSRSGFDYVPIDATKLVGVYGTQFYNETADRYGEYKEISAGSDYTLPERTVPQSPIFVNPKIKR